MALTRITKGVIKPNEHYDTHNINSTGIVTAIGLDVNGNADISGNFSVGGVLTYEDVTSIDSVGIITAQKDIHVGAGVSAVGVGTFGSLDVDGHTNLDNTSIAGITTHNEDVWFKGATSGRDAYWDKSDNSLEFYDNAKAAFGTNSKATLHHSGAQFFISNTQGGIYLRNNNKNSLIATPSDSIWLYYNNDIKFETASSGVNVSGTTTTTGLAVTGVSTFTGAIDANGDLDVDGHTNLDNVSIAGVVTATSYHGDGSNLTGVSGFATALSNDQSSSLNVFFKTPKQVNLSTGESIVVQSDATSGNIAFCRESIIHVSTGATMRVATGTQLRMNVLDLF